MDNNDFLEQMQHDFKDLDVTNGLEDLEDLETPEDLEEDTSYGDTFDENTNTEILQGEILDTALAEEVPLDSSLDDLEGAIEISDVAGDTTGIVVSPSAFSANEESTEVIAASDITAPLSFSFEDMSDALASTEIVIANDNLMGQEDQAVADQQIDECASLGFTVPEDASLDQIKDLHQYALATQLKMDYYDTFAKYYLGMTNKLANSTALHVEQHDTDESLKSSLLKCTNDPEMSQIFSRASAMVSARVTELLNTKSQFEIKPSDLNANEIFNQLVQQVTFAKLCSPTLLQIRSDEILEFIETAIAAWTSNIVNDAATVMEDGTRRENAAFVLTTESYEVTKELSNRNYAFIKHIDAVNGGNIKCTCSKCGAQNHVDSLMHFIFFYEGSSKISRYVYPSLNKCSCGALLIFPFEAYVTASTVYSETYSRNIKAMMEAAKGFGTGSTVLSVSPSLAQLPPIITSIVTDSEVSTSNTANKVVEVFDSEEWQLAVKDFYRRVELLNGKSVAKKQLTKLQESSDSDKKNVTEDSISAATDTNNYDIKIPASVKTDDSFLSLMAANTAQIAGVNYNTVKGKAFASLLNFLQSNSVINGMISFDSVMAENAALKLVEEYSASEKLDLNKFDHNVSNNLMIIAVQLDPKFEEPSDKNEICVFLREHLEELKQRVKQVNDQYVSFVDQLEKSKYSLACLPIVDYNQIPIYSIMQFAPDEKVFAILNEICDRMILNYYSGEYFDYWCRFDFQHTANLKRRLRDSADSKAISNAVSDIVSDVFSVYGVSPTDHYRQNICAQSLQKWELLKKLTDILESGNYHRFCKEALKVMEDNYGFGAQYNFLISEFKRLNLVEFMQTSAKTEIEFYLGDMFTQDELQQNSEIFEYLVFGRYIPIRQEGETPLQYVERFKTSSMVALNCKDNYVYFKRVTNLYAIVFGSAISEAKFRNIRVSNFVAFMLDSVIETQSMDSLDLIGLSTLRCSTLLQQIHPWHFSDFNSNNADVIALMNGYYFLNTDYAITNVFGAMTNCFFAASDTVTPLNKIFDFDNVLSAELQNVVSSVEGTDLAEMVAELGLWEYTPGFTERFSGE